MNNAPARIGAASRIFRSARRLGTSVSAKGNKRFAYISHKVVSAGKTRIKSNGAKKKTITGSATKKKIHAKVYLFHPSASKLERPAIASQSTYQYSVTSIAGTQSTALLK